VIAATKFEFVRVSASFNGKDFAMNQPPPSLHKSSILPWLGLLLVIILAAGAGFWLNQRIDSVKAAMAPRQANNIGETKQAITSLQQAVVDIQAGQQKLSEQLADLQRRFAAGQGERKLLSDQLGSLSGRVDALASSNADANSTSQHSQKKSQAKR
jgi:uncharacterized coiled-coil protein SlyX